MRTSKRLIFSAPCILVLCGTAGAAEVPGAVTAVPPVELPQEAGAGLLSEPDPAADATDSPDSGVAVPAIEIPLEAETELLLEDDLVADAADELPPAAEEEAGAETTASALITSPEIEAAQAHLRQVETIGEPGNPALVDALEALAIAEIEAGDFGAAEGSLNRAIEIIETDAGLYSARLARPLALLGEMYIDSGKLDEAVDAYRRAQHVVHRADGVYTLDQLDYLEKISSVFIEKRKYAEANRHKNFSFFVSEQNYGPESPELVPAIMKLGRWLLQVGKTRDARELFERATTLLENAYGPDDPSLIEPLLALSSATLKRGQYRKQREAALQRVIDIVEKTPSVDAADKAESWAKLGDFYILVDDSGRAADAYATSWNALQENDDLPDADRAVLGEPKLLHFQRRMYLMENTPRAPIDGYDRTLKEFPLDIEFEVSIGPDGRVQAVRALNLEASSTTRRQLRRYVREARFRPLIVDGKPVRADNYRFKERVVVVRPEGS